MTRETPNKSAADVKRRNQFILRAAPPITPPRSQPAASNLVSLGKTTAWTTARRVLGDAKRGFLAEPHSFTRGGRLADRSPAPASMSRRTGEGSAHFGPSLCRRRRPRHCTPPRKVRRDRTFNFGGLIDKHAKAELRRDVRGGQEAMRSAHRRPHWHQRQTVPTPYQVQLGVPVSTPARTWSGANHPCIGKGADCTTAPTSTRWATLISSKGGSSGLVKLVYDDGNFREPVFPLGDLGRPSPAPNRDNHEGGDQEL